MSGRYAMNEKAEALSMDAFFELVNQKAITQEQLQNLSVKPLKQKKTIVRTLILAKALYGTEAAPYQRSTL